MRAYRISFVTAFHNMKVRNTAQGLEKRSYFVCFDKGIDITARRYNYFSRLEFCAEKEKKF